MPADPSSSIPSALTQLAHADPLRPAEAPGLLAYLATIGDPRARKGRRHPLVAILAMAAAAVLTGARSITAIAEWAADTPQPVRAALGARRDVPDRWVVPTETTIRRTFARLDAEALAAAIGAWLADRDRPGQRRRAVAVDGKTLRGARHDGRQAHLLAAMDHATRAVVAQRQVDGAPGEVPGFRPLLADLDLADTVVTADALQTHRDAAEFLVVAKRAHYLLAVKANQPTLRSEVEALFAAAEPAALDSATDLDKGHGRIEERTITVAREVDWLEGARRFPGELRLPDVACVVRVASRTELKDCCRFETRYYISSAPLTATRAAHGVRGHWRIENSLHWVLDVVFADDQSRLRKGHGAHNMAVVRHFALNLVRSAPDRPTPARSPLKRGPKSGSNPKAMSLKLRRKMAGWNSAYMQTVLGAKTR